MKAIASFHKKYYIPIKYITQVFEEQKQFFIRDINNRAIQITRETYNALVEGMEIIG